MTLNSFTAAIAAKLGDLFPGRKVFEDEIPKDCDGNYFIRIVDSQQSTLLDRRRKRNIQFEILHFLKSNKTYDFQQWAETMYDNFENLMVQEESGETRLIRLTEQKARRNGAAQAYQFQFTADFHFVLAPESGEAMETIERLERLKDGKQKG